MLPPLAVRAALIILLACATRAQASKPQSRAFPPASGWEHVEPAAAGMDAKKLAAAIEFAQTQASTWPKDFRDQERMFGKLLGPMPKDRADTNGLVVRHGRVVAEFGDTARADPTYSVAKSMLATVMGIAVREKIVTDLDARVGAAVGDGGYVSEHNARITWRHHLQQESEWQGEMWGKSHDFVGKDAFGSGERKPRELQAPGSFYEYNDVRINRFALSLLRVLEKPVPDVFRAEVMEPIGASSGWQWIAYDNAFVERFGKKLPSVSGGTRWGGGVWISAQDLARFGYLWLCHGKWGERQIVPQDYVRQALQPSAHGPDYGYLWWLNTKGQNWPGLPANCFGARGAGSNTVFVAPDHDLVIVWRWHEQARNADAKFFAMVVGAVAG